MAVNKTLVGLAGGAIGYLGTQKAILYSMYSPKCLDAIEKGTQAGISLNCPGMDNLGVITLISICVGVAILLFFWQDILRATWNRVFGET